MSADKGRQAPVHRSVAGGDPMRGAARRRPPLRPERRRDPRVIAIGVTVGLALIVGVLAFLVLAGRDGDEVTVPNVIGLSTDEAVDALEGLGLGADTELVVRDGAVPGTVVGQEPEADVSVRAGFTVRLDVARDDVAASPGQVVVPDVVGISQADALAALAELGLAGDTQPVALEGASPGTVVAQDPPGDTVVAPGSQVRLEVVQEEASGPNVIAWILSLGPGAPTGPPEFQAYQLLRDRVCGTLAQDLVTDGSALSGLDEQARALYGAAADACLAAFEGQTDRWAAAQEALQTLQRPVSCLDVAAYELLAQLVDAHGRNPEAQFQANTDPSTGYAPPCPTITALAPDRGPSGTVVRVSGTNLDHVERVLVQYDNGDLDDTEQAVLEGGSWVLTINAPADARSACIYLEAATGWNAAGARFTIEPSDVPGASPTAGAPVPPLDPCPPESQS